ncbi:pirin family protein [Nonlabens sp.]|uniref:pirin family protein n=1 Tax=Nonlabens sp. TaxID=1888209 RepID=UPI0025CFFA4B|nr:pirin family protein [Nonlabens sp.]
MNTILHRSDSRGHANHGWLNSHHSFSFAGYHNPERMSFGVLRVLNDDTVAAGMGFGAHPHTNMEIISIPLSGDLKHQDSTGRTAIIKNGDIQVMSAGTGITHSEKNASTKDEVKFLQIWVIPNKQQVTPRYDQVTLDPKNRCNQLEQILSPNPDDQGVWIYQDAWFYLGTFEKGIKSRYELNMSENGVYAFVLKGSFQLGDHILTHRDGLGIWNLTSIELISLSDDAEILLMEVPMK